PVVVKARRHGYDGQGTFIVDNEETLISKWGKIGYVPILIEDYIPFKQELAIMVVRSITGEIITYPVVETQQKNQVCHRVLVRDDIEERIIKEVEAIAIKFVESLNAVGIFGIEFFLTENNQILINEIAPRTHNSGHYTIDACHTSQFAQHLRAICGLPFGDITMKKPGAVMVNLLGYENSHNDYLSKREKIKNLPNTYIHWYGKTESRIGRKLGHVTVLSDSGMREELEKIADEIEEIWYNN
ncbi:MAG TPA: ATP-grasp domain-containing protein, partial [Allocoleopsis sp.]